MAGADTSQGPGWWQASDGKWYAPDQASASPPAAPVIPPAPMTPGPAPAPSAPGQPGSTNDGDRGFFARLFDVSMKSFITPSIIKVLFVLGLILITIVSVVILAAGLFGDGATLLVLLAPVFWFFGVLYLRVLLEVIIVFFRIEENTRSTR